MSHIDPAVAEEVRNTIAAYAQALDSGRTEDIVDTFTPDGVSDIQGVGTFTGHAELRAGYAGMAPTAPQLHLVGNVRVTSATPDEATAVSNVLFVRRGESGWTTHVIGRYEDVLRRHDGRWRFSRRITTFQL